MMTELQSEQDLDQLLQHSRQDPVILFKHSTQCSRSADALEELNAFIPDHEDVLCGLVMVIENRDVSDEVEDRFGIRHESPQAIVFVNGKPVWHASHWKVTAKALEDAIENHRLMKS